MDEADDKAPPRPAGKAGQARADRLAEALKANLRRRKQQARGRREEPRDDASSGEES